LSVTVTVQSPAIWIIPFAQLKSTARAAWQRDFPGIVMPQITTVRDWAAGLGVVAKAPTDIHFDAGIDRLIAESLIPKSLLAKMGTDGLPTAVQRLLDMAYALAPKAAALHPSSRLTWANQHAPLFQLGGQFELEGAIGYIALMWAATSSYDTDVLWQRQEALLASAEHFYTTIGLQVDPLLAALLQPLSDMASQQVSEIDLGAMDAPNLPLLDEYIATDFEDLVQQTAALVLQAVGQNSNHKNIALLAIDRQITRRVSAVLANRGVHLVDETGWALSTTTVAAQLMAWLEAVAGDALSDVVLAALKVAPSRFPQNTVSELEQHIRRQSAVQWVQTGSELLGDWPVQFSRSHSIADWLQTTRELLQHLGLWDAMQFDAAGEAMCKALWMDAIPDPAIGARMSYKAFVQWVRAVLEASRFRITWRGESTDSDEATVTILPLAQTWGRRFDAVIVPSCTEAHLPARPRVQSDWSMAQREALCLLTSDDAAAEQSKAWVWLCSLLNVSLLWQQMDGAEALQKSSLLQVLEMGGRLKIKKNMPREAISSMACEPVIPFDEASKNGASIDWQTLAPAHLSASGYADFRACPYRFYATRILGLQDSDELDETVGKRDFGTWLHGTLYRFHESLKHDPAQERTALLDRCAKAEQKALRLDDAAFLPFALIWPKTREAYLAWLAAHEASGARYVSGEVKKEFSLIVQGKTVKLIGTLDRIDTDDAAGSKWLLDYKTEALDKTKKRVKNTADKNALEDTQLAFYAALVRGNGTESDGGSDVPIRAAYVNLAERAKGAQTTQTIELVDIESRTDALLDGIWDDLSSMAEGVALKATGALDGGEACTFCAARGLCRRDFV
jgi:ATP-dependent helicase/nuclease subunit B